MFILSVIAITVVMLITQINPITIVQESFSVPKIKASGQVMGIVEIAERNEQLTVSKDDLTQEIIAPNKLIQPKTPIKKDVYMAPPDITANSAVAFDLNSRKILYEKNGDVISSIASITKLMTALVVLEQKPDFTKEYVIDKEDRREGGRIFLFWGDRVTIDDLLHASLVGSGNTETIALVHSLGMTEADFVSKMNAKAAQLGLRKTTFADPVGLSPQNTSTAYELIEIAAAAFAQPKIQKAVLSDSYTLTTKQGKTRLIESTDNLLKTEKDYQILGGKTGYLGSAGFCFVGKFQNKDLQNDIISVILGSSGVDLRFSETEQLVNWVYENYVWSK